jgi:DNA-directed RNA polymerase specialized sigma24 family protein
MSRRSRRNYPNRAVRYLVEGYRALHPMKSTKPGRGLDILCQLIDVESAISRLGPLEYQAVLLVGLLGFSEWDAGVVLGVSQATVSRRYARALEMLSTDLNGDSDEQG